MEVFVNSQITNVTYNLLGLSLFHTMNYKCAKNIKVGDIIVITLQDDLEILLVINVRRQFDGRGIEVFSKNANRRSDRHWHNEHRLRVL